MSQQLSDSLGRALPFLLFALIFVAAAMMSGWGDQRIPNRILFGFGLMGITIGFSIARLIYRL